MEQCLGTKHDLYMAINDMSVEPNQAAVRAKALIDDLEDCYQNNIVRPPPHQNNPQPVQQGGARRRSSRRRSSRRRSTRRSK